MLKRLKPRKPLKKLNGKSTKIIPFSEIDPDIKGFFFGDSFPIRPQRTQEQVITSLTDLKILARKMESIPAFAYDTETNTLTVQGDNKKFRLVGISISWGQSNNYYIPLGHLRREDAGKQLTIDLVVKYLRPVFEREDVYILGANLKFDIHVLTRVGIKIRSKYLIDCNIMSWLTDENTPNSLKDNSTRLLKVKQERFNEVLKTVPNTVKKEHGLAPNSKPPFSLVLIEDAYPYAIDDAFFSWCLCFGFVPLLEQEGMTKIYWKMYVPLIYVLYDMEEKGVAVNKKKLEVMGVEMLKDMDKLQYQIYELSGIEFNIGSPQQKAEILFGYEKPSTVVTNISKLPKFLQKAYEERDHTVLRSRGYFIENKKLYKESSTNKSLLAKSFHFPVDKKTATGVPSTDNDTIWRLSKMEYKTKRKKEGVKMCEYLMQYSKLSKLYTAFVEGIKGLILDDGKVHPSFNLTGTDSGRLSCSEPNLQQLPNAEDDDKYQIRDIFIGSIDEVTGKRKKIVTFDYHNLEMVVLTFFSGDKNLSNMFANHDDAHGSTAVNMFNLDCTPAEAKKKYPHLRQAGKTLNFLLMYGGGAKLLYENLKNDHYSPVDLGAKEYLEEYKCSNGKEVAQVFIDKYFDSYSGVAKFIRNQKKSARKDLCVYTLLGRKRRLPDILSPDSYISSYCERLATNSTIQGSAGDITLNAQLRIAREQRLKELRCDMIIQIHDEIVYECPEENVPEAMEIIKYLMEHPFGDKPEQQVTYLQANGGIGDSYQEAK